MAIPPLISSSIQGIQRGTQGLRRNATEIAGATHGAPQLPTRNLTRAMVELQQSNRQVSASVKALRAADQMIGSLLDIKA